MKIILEVLLTLALIGLRTTQGYHYPNRERRIFYRYAQRSAQTFLALHIKDYQAQRGVNDDSSCACGKSNEDKHSQSSGDEVQPPHKYPWMVALKKKGDRHIFCGGTLISDSFVLTAAHCMERNALQAHLKEAKSVNLWNPSEIVVEFVTETEKLQPGPPVEKLIPHPRFNFNKINHDIGLVKLSRPLPCGKFTRPICLSPIGIPVTIGKIFSITGWGTEEAGNEEGSRTLLEAQIKHVPFSLCEDKFHWKMKPNYYCLKGLGGQSPCHGDSGGPMFKKDQDTYYLLGVASMHSSDLCHPDDVFLYTSVSRHIVWIRHIIMKLSPIRPKVSSPKRPKVSSPIHSKASSPIRPMVSSPNVMRIRGMKGPCRENEEFKTCGSACQDTCAKRKPICTKQCVSGCFCIKGYIREKEGGKCIPTRKCPRGFRRRFLGSRSKNCQKLGR